MAFAEAIQQAVSCVTVARFLPEGYRSTEEPYSGSLGRGRPVSLGRDSELSVKVALRYRIVPEAVPGGGWIVQIVSYIYALADVVGVEFVAYQWDPYGRSPVTWPNVHLGPALGLILRRFMRAHLPTGPVALQDVIRVVITDLGVVPRRPDWELVLERTRTLTLLSE